MTTEPYDWKTGFRTKPDDTVAPTPRELHRRMTTDTVTDDGVEKTPLELHRDWNRR